MIQQGIFEIEAGTMERFLELLRSREEEGVPSEDETLPRRAVFVAPSGTPAPMGMASPWLPGGCAPRSPTGPTW